MSQPMQTLLTTSSQSWAQSVRIELLSAGIHVAVREEWTVAGSGIGAPIQIVTVPDTELAKARRILARLPLPDQDLRTSGIQRIGLLLIGCGLFLGIYALLRLTNLGPEPLSDVLLGTGVLSVVYGATLIARGASRRREQ